MTKDEIIRYYDYLMRLAISKCNSRADAEDLVGDTMLAAFTYLHKGGAIEHPKTWLANTFFHKYHDHLRRKYRCPVTVCLEDMADMAEEADEESLSPEEAAEVRKELNFLACSTREVLIRFYFGNQSVSDIAEALNIPEGTVKSRLAAGRSQMKKGLENMERNNMERKNILPGRLDLSFGGREGLRGDPVSFVEDDLIAQNLLMLAYEKPVGLQDLSKAIGIPAVYIEPIVKKLVDRELMQKTDGGRVYSDFIITKPQDALRSFRPQMDFAHKHFDTVWNIIEKMSEQISRMPFEREMGAGERTRLDRYAVLKALQDFQYFGTGKIEMPKFPRRRDGGRWLAQGIAFEAGYHMKEYEEASQYQIHGGHRTTEAFVERGARLVRLYEFDTTLFDCPNRYGKTRFSMDLYFKHIVPFLWCIYADIPLEERVGDDIPSELISYIPALEEAGLLGNVDHKLCVKIPVLKKEEYERVHAVIRSATEEISSTIGEEFATFIASQRTPLPRHLTSVPELYRYSDATGYFVMAIVREAYGRGLHLKDVDYCCPPVVMTWACGE